MLFLLPAHSSTNHLQQLFVRCSTTQNVSKREFRVSEQTHLRKQKAGGLQQSAGFCWFFPQSSRDFERYLQVSISSDSQTVAGATEMVRHGGYEAQMTFKAWYFKHLLQTKSFPLKLPYGLLILKHEKTMNHQHIRLGCLCLYSRVNSH